MSGFVRINKTFSIDQNFWELNPQLVILPPFNKLYKIKDSSKIMWCIFFMCDPDEDENKLYRLQEEKRKETIEGNYYKVNWEDPLIKECLEAYPFECMSSIERALKDEKDSLVRRANLFRTTELTLDKTKIIDGKSVVIKGTAIQLDTMRAKTLKIYEEFEKVEAKFKEQKAEEARVYGGRKETASEKGDI